MYHFWCQGAHARHRIQFSTQPICGCNNCKMTSTLRNSHQAMRFMGHGWGKHPWVMTTSVGPALTTKLLKLCRLTSQENPRKRPKRACYLRGGGDRGKSDTGSRDINLHLNLTNKNFYIKKCKKRGFHLSGKELRKQQFSSERTGWSAFLPFHEDCWTDERNNTSKCTAISVQKEKYQCVKYLYLHLILQMLVLSHGFYIIWTKMYYTHRKKYVYLFQFHCLYWA